MLPADVVVQRHAVTRNVDRREVTVRLPTSATMLMEKTTPATVIIEPAIAESMAREPSAPGLKSAWPGAESVAIEHLIQLDQQ